MYILNFLVLLMLQITFASDYYELLGIQRSATTREIRKAYKKLALILHPDKNPGDTVAEEKFVKLTRAYEVLKDEVKRKHYDTNGDEEAKFAKTKYQSYYYYEHEFGIYDDDPNVITLSGSDFENYVEKGGNFGQWFIKFYSPLCASCHHAAPAWSKLASELNGAVSFGAINCEDDWDICRRKAHINGYPTYVLFPSGDRLVGGKDREELEHFLIHRITSGMKHIKSISMWDTIKNDHNRWLLMFEEDINGEQNVEKPEHTIIAAMLQGLVEVALIYCAKVPCSTLKINNNRGYVFMEHQGHEWKSTSIAGGESKEVFDQILALLPPIKNLDPKSFNDHLIALEEGYSTPLLVYFHLGPPTNLDMEVKKLTGFLPDFEIRSINCGRFMSLCSELSISRYPLFAIFKQGGGREFYHGAHIIQSVAAFARETSNAINFKEFGPRELNDGLRQGDPLLVDFFVPWCPPCMKLLPELRKASLFFTPSEITFASVDCTIHSDICRQHSVTSYPTTLLFNMTRRPVKMGSRTADAIREFVDDTMAPKVIELDENLFYFSIGNKPINELWVVDFFMPWCGPCQQMDPHYRKLAKIMDHIPYVKIAKVNCEEEVALCREQGIQSYPHIRLYPKDSKGMSSVMIYNGYQRDTQTLLAWIHNFIPSSIKQLDPISIRTAINSGKPWLVDFYAPWCAHCKSFEPEFIIISQKLEGTVSTGKLDCDRYYTFCQGIGINRYPTVRLFTEGFSPEGSTIHSQDSAVILSTVEKYLRSRVTHDEL